MRMLGAAAALAGVPVLALGALAATGQAPAGPVAVAIGVTLLAVVALAVRWVRDIDILRDTARRIAADEPMIGRMPVLPGLHAVGVDLERLARRATARTALIEQLRRADATVVERLPDPLIVLAADRAVRRANSAARSAFGSEMPAVLRHPDLRAALDRAFASGQTQSAELVLPVPVPREVHAAVVPMDPPIADGGRIVVVLSDRTRERAVERMRADFVANVSHELRTPLASLIGFIETLRGPAADDPPAQQRFLGIMGEQAARMNRLIDDLLSLSRIELVEHQVPSASVDLRALVTRLVAGFEPRLRDRAVKIDLHLPGDLPMVTGDADQLTQVLQNLLDNAVKYGRRDGTIRVEVAAAAGRPGIVLRVADQGIGIPREHLPRLTERFYRVDTGRSRAAGGTGLGLAIVKHIVNRHRGQLSIESEEGIGTTVSVWLPQAGDAACRRARAGVVRGNSRWRSGRRRRRPAPRLRDDDGGTSGYHAVRMTPDLRSSATASGAIAPPAAARDSCPGQSGGYRHGSGQEGRDRDGRGERDRPRDDAGPARCRHRRRGG
ncbi:MAG: ATP-binding protein [Acetobacteraceae bacterium]